MAKKPTKKLKPATSPEKESTLKSIENLENQKLIAKQEGDTQLVKHIDKIIKRLLNGDLKCP